MKHVPKPSIQEILAHSYITYLVSSIVGLFMDSFFRTTFDVPLATPLAVVFFILGPALIAWAQYTSRHFRHFKQESGEETHYFNRGPYRYMRNPTHLGLLILVTGYTLVSGSLIFFLVTLIGFMFANIFFQKYESFLDRAYGKDYRTYKESVSKIL